MDNYSNSLYTMQNSSACQNSALAPYCTGSTSCPVSDRHSAVINCGSGSAGPLPIMDLAGASIVSPYSVASVNLNLKGFKNPTVLITFTGLINVPAGALPNISFRLKKSCGGSSQAIGGSYNYSSAINVLQSQTFAFQVCDCGECCECVTYTVEISNATLAQAGTTVSGTISAIAVDNCSICC